MGRPRKVSKINIEEEIETAKIAEKEIEGLEMPTDKLIVPKRALDKLKADIDPRKKPSDFGAKLEKPFDYVQVAPLLYRVCNNNNQWITYAITLNEAMGIVNLQTRHYIKNHKLQIRAEG